MIEIIEDFQTEEHKRRGNVKNDLIEFMQSSGNACKVDTSEYKTLNNAQTTYWRAITRHGNPMRAMTRNGVLYLVKTDTEGGKTNAVN